MIEFIHGKLESCSPAHAVLQVQGIGYFINISLNTYTRIQALAEVRLYIHEHIREDIHALYGFQEEGERELFRQLITVSGIGANTARMMLSSHQAGELQQAITTANVDVLKGIKGIGLKTAQRIIVELKDKLGKTGIPDHLFTPQDNTVKEEALSALVMLGFVKTASQKVVDKIVTEQPGAKVEEIIRQALKML